MSNRFPLHRRRPPPATPISISRIAPPNEEQSKATNVQEEKIRSLLFRGNWSNSRDGLAPQLTRRQAQMVSIGLSIGTGLFLGSGGALKNGGPLGILLGYLLVAFVVYCFIVSISEMLNSNGLVGLASKFVDPALGFALGWNSWFNWSIAISSKISAASALVNYWNPPQAIATVWPAIFLTAAVAVNCVGVGRYGEIEFWLSLAKIVTIIALLIIGVALDAGGGEKGLIGFKNWKEPLPSYLEIPGTVGRFLGVYAVMIQATFTFYGIELFGMVAGEVINARQTIPIIMRRAFIKIAVLYISGVFVAGLLVPANHPGLKGDDNKRWVSSPFIIALQEAGPKWAPLRHLFVALFISSAWSAATADVFVSSRYLYFLAKSGLAPEFCGYVYTNVPKQQLRQKTPTNEQNLLDVPEATIPSHALLRRTASVTAAEGSRDSSPHRHEVSGGSSGSLLSPPSTRQRATPNPLDTLLPVHQAKGGPGDPCPENGHPKKPIFAIPWVGVLVAAAFSMMSFMYTRRSGTQPGSAEKAFAWLVSMTTAASLLSWIAMLFTYIRFYQGTRYHEKQNLRKPRGEWKFAEEIEEIKKNRHWGQPYTAIFAMILCFLVSFFHGWSILKTGQWKVYERRVRHDAPTSERAGHDERLTIFLTCYLQTPVFLLLTFGYKLTNQTKMVLVEHMIFDRDAEAVALEDDALPVADQPPTEWYNKILWFLFS